MTNHNRNQLIELGAEALADTLLNLCLTSPEDDDVVKRLLATPDQNIKRFKTKLVSLKRVSWSDSTAFAGQLQQLLSDLDAGVREPHLGVELVGKFFEADAAIFDRFDDSNGEIGDVFRYAAANLFVSFASCCEHKQKIAELVITLNRKDDYGIRDCLFERASEYLPEVTLRTMIQLLWSMIEKENDDYQKSHWYHAIQTLAKQLKDARLFEEAALASGRLSVAAWLDIAQVYLECGEPQIALSRLGNIPDTETFKFMERSQLLLAIYHQLGNIEAETDIAWQIFKKQRTQTTLTQLLDVIGHEQLNAVIDDEIVIIFQEPSLSYNDANFLLSMERINELESYLFQRIEQLDGKLYNSLLPLAEAFEKSDKPFISSLIYRTLIDAILTKAQSKYYHHGVKYLKKLDHFAPFVSDWQTFPSHRAYFDLLQEQHKRKSAFWSKY